jgi:hypothetical protein
MDANTAMAVTKEEGVRDLDVKAKLYFARALFAERNGKPGEAAEWLEKAVAAEAKP